MEKDRPSLAVRALVILAAVTAAAAATIPQASAAKPSTGPLGGPSTGSERPQLAMGVHHHDLTATPSGLCPPPVIPPPTWQQPSLVLSLKISRHPSNNCLVPLLSAA